MDNLAFIKSKNETKKKFYDMFHGRIDKEVIDMVLAECFYDDTQAYENLIVMVEEAPAICSNKSLPQRKNIPVFTDQCVVEYGPSKPISSVESHHILPEKPTNMLEQITSNSLSPQFSLSPEILRHHPPLPQRLTEVNPHELKKEGYPFWNTIPSTSVVATDITWPSSIETSTTSVSEAIPSSKHQKTSKQTQNTDLSLSKVDESFKQYINDSSRKVLILMRGLPGSGKSYKARKLCGEQGAVFSTDDYFDHNGKYQFDHLKLSEAHQWNQNRAKMAIKNGVSPIFIDNTNIQIWEMQPYVKAAMESYYVVKIVEPDTDWAWKPSKLEKKNCHYVTKESIKKMIDRFENVTSVSDIMKKTITPDKKESYSPNRNKGRSSNENSPQKNSKSSRRSPHSAESNSITTRNSTKYIEYDKQPQSSSFSKVQSTRKDCKVKSCEKEITTSTFIHERIILKENSPKLINSAIQKSKIAGVDFCRAFESSSYQDPLKKPLQHHTNLQINKSSNPGSSKLVENEVTSRFSLVQDSVDHMVSTSNDDWKNQSQTFEINDGKLEFLHGKSENQQSHISTSPEESYPVSFENITGGRHSVENYLTGLSSIVGNFSNSISSLAVNSVKEIPATSTTAAAMCKKNVSLNQTASFDDMPFIAKSSKSNIDQLADSYKSWSSKQNMNSFQPILDDGRNEVQSDSRELVSPQNVLCLEQMEFQLKFLMECFPDFKRDYLKDWLKRYNGDIVRTCDYLSRLSQVDDLPDEMSDIIMVEDTGSDDDDVIEQKECIDLSSSPKPVKRPNGEMYFCEDQTNQLKIAMDKRLGLELIKHFGDENKDFDDLCDEDLMLDIDLEFGKLLFDKWINSIRAKKRKLEDLVMDDEEYAMKLQEEENKKVLLESPDNQKKKKRAKNLNVSTTYLKNQTAQLFAPENAWQRNDLKKDDSSPKIKDASGHVLTSKELNTRKELHNMYPGIDESALDNVLEASSYNFEAASNLVQESCGLNSFSLPEVNITDDNPNEWNIKTKPKKIHHVVEQAGLADLQEGLSTNEDNNELYQTMTEDNQSYADLRAEAEMHKRLRLEYFQKAAIEFQKKEGQTAQYYAEKAQEHTIKMKEAHARAAEITILRRNSHNMKDQKTIDLHGLHSDEALRAVKNFINNAKNIRHRWVYVITGRGTHSKRGVSTIRNTVIYYLQNNGLRYEERCNGGMLCVRIP